MVLAPSDQRDRDELCLQVWLQKRLVIGVVALSWLLPYVYMYSVFHWVAMVHQAWYPRAIDWLLDTDLNLFRLAVGFHLWALTGTITWSAMLAMVAWILVRWFPGHRGVVLTIFLF